jgi:hypothetical protein
MPRGERPEEPSDYSMRDVGKEGLQGIGVADELQERLEREPVQQCPDFGPADQFDSESVSLLPKVEDLFERGEWDLTGADCSDFEAGIDTGFEVRDVVLNGRTGEQDEGALPNVRVGMPAEPPHLPQVVHLEGVSVHELPSAF